MDVSVHQTTFASFHLSTHALRFKYGDMKLKKYCHNIFFKTKSDIIATNAKEQTERHFN